MKTKKLKFVAMLVMTTLCMAFTSPPDMTGIYEVNHNGYRHALILYTDSTFAEPILFSQLMGNVSLGTWKHVGDSLILNEPYRPVMDDEEFEKSLSEYSDSTANWLRDIRAQEEEEAKKYYPIITKYKIIDETHLQEDEYDWIYTKVDSLRLSKFYDYYSQIQEALQKRYDEQTPTTK